MAPLLRSAVTATALLAVQQVQAAYTPSSSTTSVSAMQNNLNTLNYALTLEHLEAAYYRMGQNKFNRSDFQAAGFPDPAWNDVNLIMQEEQEHVAILTQAIESLGGTPVGDCYYNLDEALSSVPAYLAYAAVFENVGVSAYDGAIFAFSDPALAQVAAQIAVVEGRHVSTVRYLQNLLPFPLALGNATTPMETVNAVAPFFASCPNGTATSSWPVPNGLPGLSLPVSRAMTTDYSAPANSSAHDLITVNYAITYENLEQTFYGYLLSMFNSTDFEMAGYASNTYDWLTLVLRNEQTHTQVLQTIGMLLGNTAPLPVCEYKFPNVTSPAQVIYYMALVCETGAGAFTGAADTIYNPIVQQAAAQIATIEGRQVAYMESLMNTVPVPYTFERAYNTSTVLNFASNFLVGCPYTVAGPTQPDGIQSDAYVTDPPQSSGETSPYSMLKRNKHFRALKK